MVKSIPSWRRFVCLWFIYSVLLTFAFISAKAQLVVEAAQTANGNYVEINAYPLLTAQIRALRNGVPIALSVSNIYIVEGNYSARPFNVEAQSGGYQKIYWHSRSRGVRVGSNDVQFVVSEGNDVGTITVQHFLGRDVQLRFKDFVANPVYNLSFGKVLPGKDSTIPAYIAAQTTRVDVNEHSEAVRIDSITTRTKYFTWKWIGTPIVSSKTPPTYIQSPFRYRIDISFHPDSVRFYRDELTVHYEGGAEEYFELTGNSFELPQNTILNITQPNERLTLSPCQTVDIRWKGAVYGSPVYIEYSVGAAWQQAGTTLDSFFIWTVPAQYTDSLLVRVRQEYTNFSEAQLQGESAGAYSICYNKDGSKATVAYENGAAVEYSVAQQIVLQKYSIGNIGYPAQKAACFGISYIGENKIVAGYRRPNGEQELDFWVSGSTSPIIKKIDAAVKFKRLLIDPSGQSIICVPDIGNLLYFYSSADGSLLKTVLYASPITAFSLNADGNGVVALLDGTIARVSSPEYAPFSEMRFQELPIVNGVALSPNNQLIGVATKASTPTISSGTGSTVHIIDIGIKNIIRSLRKTSSDAIDIVFNGTSRYLGMGFPYQPQVGLWQIVDDEFNRGLSGHAGQMTSISYSPDGRSIATTALSPDNVIVRNFSYPETDVGDSYMRIVPVKVSTTSPTLKSNILMNRRDTVLRSSVCNSGEAILRFETAKFLSGKHFSFAKQITALDTINPGKCLEILLAFQPKDTGILRDTLLLISCSGEYLIPIEGYSANRNIAFLSDNADFGESCAGDSIFREIEILRNDDSVPLEIDQLLLEDGFTSGFTFAPPIPKTILQPGEVLKATVRFFPKIAGADASKIYVLHSGQSLFVPSFTLRGRGLGADVAVVSDIRFIPEIPTRSIGIKNNSQNVVVLRSASSSPPNAITISPVLPITIQPNDSIMISVSANTPLTESGAPLEMEFNPCVVKKTMIAGAYSGISSVSAPVVEADPRGETTIPIMFKNAENKPYNGVRFFEGEFAVNPRLFLPLRVESDFGSGSITRNEIIDGKRIVGFRAEGNFATSGVAARVIGLAGLAETDRSPIDFLSSSLYWGVSVQTTASSGELRIKNVCDGCRIIQPRGLAILSIAPNPANYETKISFNAPLPGEYLIEILNEIGLSIAVQRYFITKSGENFASVPLGMQQAGAYRITIRGVAESASAPLYIVK